MTLRQLILINEIEKLVNMIIESKNIQAIKQLAIELVKDNNIKAIEIANLQNENKKLKQEIQRIKDEHSNI